MRGLQCIGWLLSPTALLQQNCRGRALAYTLISVPAKWQSVGTSECGEREEGGEDAQSTYGNYLGLFVLPLEQPKFESERWLRTSALQKKSDTWLRPLLR